MDDCENMLSRSMELQNAIKRRNVSAGGNDDGTDSSERHGSDEATSLCRPFQNTTFAKDAHSKGNNNKYSKIENDTNLMGNFHSFANDTTFRNTQESSGSSRDDSHGNIPQVNFGNIDGASNSDSASNSDNVSSNDDTDDISNTKGNSSNKINTNKEDTNITPTYTAPSSGHQVVTNTKKPLSRLEYPAQKSALGLTSGSDSGLWTLPEQDEEAGDDDYNNSDIQLIEKGTVGARVNMKKNISVGDAKVGEIKAVRDGARRRGGHSVDREREMKKRGDKQNNSRGCGGKMATNVKCKAVSEEDWETRAKWEEIMKVIGGVEEEEKKKKEGEEEALTPNYYYSSNEYEFETTSEKVGLLRKEVDKQSCGASSHSATMLHSTTTTTSGQDTESTVVTWSDSYQNQLDSKGLRNNFKKIIETTTRPKRIETKFHVDNNISDETMPLVGATLTTLPTPTSPTKSLSVNSLPSPSILSRSKHANNHSPPPPYEQQNPRQQQQPRTHSLLLPYTNSMVSTNSSLSRGDSVVSTISNASNSSLSPSYSSSSSSPTPTATSVTDQEVGARKEDPFLTEVLDPDPKHPTTGHSINDIIKMPLEEYVVLKDEENKRRLSVDVLPNHAKPRQSYCKMLLQKDAALHDTENAADGGQSTNALKSNLRVNVTKKRQNKHLIANQNKTDPEKCKKDLEENKKSVRDGFFIILSAIYGMLLVVLGAVIPISETFAESTTIYFFDAFYIYLYIGSCLFILYVHSFLLRRNTKTSNGHRFSFYRQWSRSWSFRRRSDRSSDRSDGRHRRKFTTDVAPHNPNGSFYLRLGAIGFGIGGMIHSGLQLGQHLQVVGGSGKCNGLMQIVKPLFHLIFTFVQLYFVFLNPKVCIHRYKTLARFGLMHMCGTNICVWFGNIVVETLHEMHRGVSHSSNVHGSHGDNHLLIEHHQNNHSAHPSAHTPIAVHAAEVHPIGNPHNSSIHLHSNHNENYSSKIIAAIASPMTSNDSPASLKPVSDLTCYWNKMMGQVVEQAGPYLYPCSIEYSLICAGIMFVLWQQVGRGPKPIITKSSGQNGDDESQGHRSYRLSVDCGGSSRGLFVGILLFVGAVITMVAFYVLVNKENMTITALALVHLSEIIIYLLGLLATITAAWRMRGLAYKPGHASVLENVLILISLTGVFIFCLFGIIAALFHEESGITNTLSIASNLMMIIQSIVQTVFMTVGGEMQAYTQAQERQKPGRELVTFLILCNLSLWGINTFETQRAEHNPIQTDFYGHMAWAILTHISVPLGIFFRFHSTVCLSNIWKNAWKLRQH
ncbi:uncharacterized protein LOC115209666 [Argonauta hians]